jgi:hypothetical protein
MDSIDAAIATAIAHLYAATPNPIAWQGSAANACAGSITQLIEQLQSLRVRLSSWAM